MSQGAIRRLLGALARPVRRARGGTAIQAYRGYGTARSVHLVGRVLRQPGGAARRPRGRLLRDLVGLVQRFLRWGIGGRRVEARLGEAVQTVKTGRSGWFEVDLEPVRLEDPDSLWHDVELRLPDSPDVGTARGRVLVPPPRARHAVISDIDDTVVHTGVANALEMLANLFLKDAESRVAFPGVGALYQGLHAGADGESANPLLYVSRGPWSLYEVLEEFFHLHRIPVGPVLFLRDWGLTLQHPLPRKALRHKQELIERMLSTYEDLPFVLVGDSGQRDPEIYADVVRRHRDRIAAVWIRNVDENDAERREAIEELARSVADAGSSLILAADSLAMAEHAAELGLVPPETLGRVRAEMEEAGERPRGKRREADPDAAGEILEDAPDHRRPPNLEVG